MPNKLFRRLTLITMVAGSFASNSFAQESTTRSNLDAASPVPLEDKTSRNDVDADGRVGSFGVSLFGLTAVPRRTLNEGGASVFTYFYPSLNYRIGSGQKFALRPVFLIDSFGKKSNGEDISTQARPGDLRLAYSDYDMVRFGDYTTFGGSTYWDYPTSAASLDRKILSKFSGWYQLTRVITPRLTVAYNMKPEFILNSRNSTRFFNSMSNNRLGEWDHYLEFTYDINRTFAPVASVGYRHEFYQVDPGVSRIRKHEDFFKSGFGSWIQVNRGVRFLALVQNEVNLRARNGVGLYRDGNFENRGGAVDETDFVLLTFISLK